MYFRTDGFLLFSCCVGAVPIFPFIDECPKLAMNLHPKKLYSALLQYPGLQYDVRKVAGKVNHIASFSFSPKNPMNKGLYMSIVAALLRYTRNVLSNEALATYIYRTMVEYSVDEHQKVIEFEKNNTKKHESILKIDGFEPKSSIVPSNPDKILIVAPYDIDDGDYILHAGNFCHTVICTFRN